MKQLSRTLLAITLLLGVLSTASGETIPGTMTLQGDLTDSFGVPVNVSQDMTFAIYGMEEGGVPLWEDTQTVEINGGQFSVELGNDGNPLPIDLFNAPLYLGISVGDNDEMVPRREITSVAFSFRAEDANTVGGNTAGELDQSAHVADSDNPHETTPGQIGAAGKNVEEEICRLFGAISLEPPPTFCPDCVPEVCNSLDDDCDGLKDEDFSGLGDGCAVGIGACLTAGFFICSTDGLSTECGASPGIPSPEVCNGIDDDCDGSIDNGAPASLCPLQEGVCAGTVSLCQSGSLVCGGEVYGSDYEAEEISCDGKDNDCDGEVDEVCSSIPAPGELVITEIMANPDSVADSVGEWIELTNVSSRTLNLNGITVFKDLSDFVGDLIGADVFVEPGGVVVLGANSDPVLNGGAEVDYVVDDGFGFNNSGNIQVIVALESLVVDAVFFPNSFSAGKARQLSNDSYDVTQNDSAANWCPSTSQMSGGDFGTPGSVNGTCAD